MRLTHRSEWLRRRARIWDAADAATARLAQRGARILSGLRDFLRSFHGWRRARLWNWARIWIYRCKGIRPTRERGSRSATVEKVQVCTFSRFSAFACSSFARGRQKPKGSGHNSNVRAAMGLSVSNNKALPCCLRTCRRSRSIASGDSGPRTPGFFRQVGSGEAALLFFGGWKTCLSHDIILF